MDTIGKRVAAARERAGMTQTQLAAVLGTHATTVSKWECDDIEPKVANVAALATALSVPFEWLALGTGAEPAAATSKSPEAA